MQPMKGFSGSADATTRKKNVRNLATRKLSWWDRASIIAVFLLPGLLLLFYLVA
jgi:hypothetical protein